ncbi:kinesin-like protein KIN-5C, partial [Tanacetum coccineum]
MYHDLYLDGKALVERENVGFDLTKSDLCPSFVEDLTAKGVGLRVADSHTGNYREDGFTPLETIRRVLGTIRSRSISGSNGRPSSRRGGAKNIKNKPEVNQKMMKTTLIKDLYGEIKRLKAEMYASREKSGVYLPKERYYQEEMERKQFEDLQTQFNARVKECSDLSSKLESTQNNLSQINKVLADTEGALKKCQYALKERDFVISEQKKAASALAHQACVLRSDLEKSIQDNASLYMKIAREDKPSAGNRSVVNKLESELAQDVGSLCKMVAASVSQQNEQIQCIEKFCQTFININDK